MGKIYSINYGDSPDLGAAVKFDEKDGDGEFWVSVQPLPGRHAKLDRLIEIVKSELAEDRGCVIYTRYSDAYAMNTYILEHLKEEGIASETLSSSTHSLARFERLNEMEEKGQKVIIGIPSSTINWIMI